MQAPQMFAESVCRVEGVRAARLVTEVMEPVILFQMLFHHPDKSSSRLTSIAGEPVFEFLVQVAPQTRLILVQFFALTAFQALDVASSGHSFDALVSQHIGRRFVWLVAAFAL